MAPTVRSNKRPAIVTPRNVTTQRPKSTARPVYRPGRAPVNAQPNKAELSPFIDAFMSRFRGVPGFADMSIQGLRPDSPEAAKIRNSYSKEFPISNYLGTVRLRTSNPINPIVDLLKHTSSKADWRKNDKDIRAMVSALRSRSNQARAKAQGVPNYNPAVRYRTNVMGHTAAGRDAAARARANGYSTYDPTVVHYDIGKMKTSANSRNFVNRYSAHRPWGLLDPMALVYSTIYHEGLPELGHAGTPDVMRMGTNDENAGLYGPRRLHGSAAKKAAATAKIKTIPITGTKRTMLDPADPNSTLNYYSSIPELLGLSNRIKYALAGEAYYAPEFNLNPTSYGRKRDVLSGLVASGWARKDPKTGYYYTTSEAYRPGVRNKLIPGYDLGDYLSHVNRLLYLQKQIKARKATPAEVGEFNQAMPVVKNSYDQASNNIRNYSQSGGVETSFA